MNNDPIGRVAWVIEPGHIGKGKYYNCCGWLDATPDIAAEAQISVIALHIPIFRLQFNL